ncbi:MAG: hypothetical protein AAF738_06190, partial [Bacteroidota bacterium]
TGYTWSVDPGMIQVSAQGADSIVINMNGIADGSYTICVVTNSNCGDSPPCCTDIDIVTCIEDCSNGIDDDGDGWTDCEDPDCSFTATGSPDVDKCAAESEIISVSPSGGVAPYTFQWDNGLSGIASHTVSCFPYRTQWRTHWTRR